MLTQKKKIEKGIETCQFVIEVPNRKGWNSENSTPRISLPQIFGATGRTFFDFEK